MRLLMLIMTLITVTGCASVSTLNNWASDRREIANWTYSPVFGQGKRGEKRYWLSRDGAGFKVADLQSSGDGREAVLVDIKNRTIRPWHHEEEQHNLLHCLEGLWSGLIVPNSDENLCDSEFTSTLNGVDSWIGRLWALPYSLIGGGGVVLSKRVDLDFFSEKVSQSGLPEYAEYQQYVADYKKALSGKPHEMRNFVKKYADNDPDNYVPKISSAIPAAEKADRERRHKASIARESRLRRERAERIRAQKIEEAARERAIQALHHSSNIGQHVCMKSKANYVMNFGGWQDDISEGGELHGFIEDFSADGSRMKVRVNSWYLPTAARQTSLRFALSAVNFDGLVAEPGSVVWSETHKWFQCTLSR